MTSIERTRPRSHQRRLTRITTRRDLGPDAQVDAKGLLFVPTDPALTDPFLTLVDDAMSSPGFDWHPHRGLQTVTTVLDGVLEHGDSLGQTGALTTGEVQWMTAGRGIIHREMAFRNEHAHMLQMWLNVPGADKLDAPGYQDLLASQMPRITEPGLDVDEHVGTVNGVRGTARSYTPVDGAVATLDPDRTWTLTVPADHRLFALVITGAVDVAGDRLQAGQIGWSDPHRGVDDTTLTLTAAAPEQRSTVMVYSGRPIGEPVALSGPFVMNTEDELYAAHQDYRRGTFGPIPRLARLDHR